MFLQFCDFLIIFYLSRLMQMSVQKVISKENLFLLASFKPLKKEHYPGPDA